MRVEKFLSIAAITISASIFSINANAEVYEKKTQQENSEIKNFEIIQHSTSKNAIIFIGGASDTFNFWDEHIKNIGSDITVIGYEGLQGKGTHPFNTDFLEDNAQAIANGIKNLKENGYTNIQIISHSLGGIVSKKALHILDDENQLEKFENVEFTAVSSPLGGFFSAAIADNQPFVRTLSKFFGMALMTDMNPFGDFYKSISKPFKTNIETTMIESDDDPVTKPTTNFTQERYDTIKETFKNKIIVISDKNHEFAKDPETLTQKGIVLVKYDPQKIEKIREKTKISQNAIEHKVKY